MVEIIKEGTKNRITCNFCGSLLSYEKCDIKETEKFFSPRNSIFQKYIICPKCKNIIILEGSK